MNNHPSGVKRIGDYLAAFWKAVREMSWDTLHLIPVAAFLFVSSVPSESLAFAEQVELAQKPLIFERDPSLASTAIVGIEAWPKQRTAGGVLGSGVSRIPDAAKEIKEGTAIRVLSTAYSSTYDQTDANPWGTASGTRVHMGTMAANFLPFGTKVRIGNTVYTVEDRLNARYNGKYIIDIWQPSREAALRYGVRVVEIEVVSVPSE
ncbi:MAG: 3D domain-containing protein [bacterium]|nr:3D domain-containing protein [bacterium]